MASMLGMTVAQVMEMSIAEYSGWVEWSKKRAETNRSRDKITR